MKKIIFILILTICFSCKDEKQSQLNNTKNLNVIKDRFEIEETNTKKDFSTKKREYHIKLHDYNKSTDTIVHFEFLNSDETLDYTFDYKPFKKKVISDTLILFDANMEVRVVKSKFIVSEAKIQYDKDSLNIIKINDHYIYGADGVPKWYISDIIFNSNGRKTHLDKKYYQDLYEPDFDGLNAYYNDEELIITMSNSDGYLGYGVNLFIDKNSSFKRIVYQP